MGDLDGLYSVSMTQPKVLGLARPVCHCHRSTIDGGLAGDGHDDFLAGARGRAGLSQDSPPLLDPSTLGLPLHQPPGQFDQRGSQSHVTVLADRQRPVGGAAGAHPATQTGVAAHLPTVGEAVPSSHLPSYRRQGQAAHAFGALGGRRGCQLGAQAVPIPSSGSPIVAGSIPAVPPTKRATGP